MPPKNHLLALFLIWTALAAVPAQGAASGPDGYPTKPVRVVLGISPGGGTDVIARAVAIKLSERLGQTFVVDNRPGAQGAIAMALLAQAPPDGYTLFVGTNDNVATATMMKKVPFDTMKAFVPIVQMDTQPYLFTVNPSLPFSSLKGLIAHAKSKPRALNYGSSGRGTQSHLGMELFESLAGVELTHVPYRGASFAAIDVGSGHIQILLGSAVTTAPYVRAGRIKPLVVTAEQRSQAYPDVPTSAEAGLPGFEVGNIHSMFAPAGTPERLVDFLNREIVNIMQAPEMKKQLSADGADPLPPNSPAEFKAKLLKSVAAWKKFFASRPELLSPSR